jgi:hypothetical protein
MTPQVKGNKPENPYPGGKEPRVEPDSIGNKPAVATIAGLEWVNMAKEGEDEDSKLKVTFEEPKLDGLVHFLNKTQYKELVQQFGSDENKWIGLRVPLMITTVRDPNLGKQVRKVWVATPAEEWDAIMSADKARGKKRK